MHKNFDGWNEIKKKTNANEDYHPLYHSRQVRWCRLGANIGFEQDGTGKDFARPILILAGLSKNTCLVVPLTTSSKKHRMRISIGKIENKLAFAVISQIRVIDTKRLEPHVATISKKKFELIRNAVRELI
jgi:mRNA interferase MazF